MPTVRYTNINGELIAEKRDNVRSLYVPDPLGSTVALLDNTQAQTDQWSYMPYGTTTRIKGSNPTPFLFVGTKGYRQDNNSRTYVRARVLEPHFGRWLTEDPIGLITPAANHYTYASDQPVRLTDRTGLAPGQKNGDVQNITMPADKPPNYNDNKTTDPGFGKEQSRKDCNDHYGSATYCSCQCQCALQQRKLSGAIQGALQACLSLAKSAAATAQCWRRWESDIKWLDRLDDACRAECLKHHRAPGAVGNPDTGPCSRV